MDTARSSFPSLRDRWIVAVTWLTVLPIAIGLGYVLTSPEKDVTFVMPTILMISAAALLLWVVYGTSYTIDGETLRVRCGPFRWRVPLGDVVDLSPTDDPSSSPACSLDRLQITYGPDKILLISPARREEFLAVMHAKCPGLQK